MLHGRDNRVEVVFETEEAAQREPHTDTELVFDEIDGFYLCEVWEAGSNVGSALPRTAEERKQHGQRSRGHGHRMVRAMTVERDASKR